MKVKTPLTLYSLPWIEDFLQVHHPPTPTYLRRGNRKEKHTDKSSSSRYMKGRTAGQWEIWQVATLFYLKTWISFLHLNNCGKKRYDEQWKILTNDQSGFLLFTNHMRQIREHSVFLFWNRRMAGGPEGVTREVAADFLQTRREKYEKLSF